VNTVATSFNTVMRQMSKMSQRKKKLPNIQHILLLSFMVILQVASGHAHTELRVWRRWYTHSGPDSPSLFL